MTRPTPLEVPNIQARAGPFSRMPSTEVSGWVQRLPLANPGACAPALLEALHRTNRAPLDKASRLAVAERLRPTVNAVCDALVKRYRTAGLPLSPEADSQARMVHLLYRELTIAFRHAVNHYVDGRRLTGARRQRALLAMQRAVLAQGRGLLEAYRIYMPEPQGFWRTLHTLYANAEALRLQGAPIEGEPDSDETALSVKQAYLRVVLLSLANPYHLMQGEAEDLYRRIGRWALFLRLATPNARTDLSGRFVLDLDSDFPPRYHTEQASHRLPLGRPRVLEREQLVETLDRQIAHLDETVRQGRHGDTHSARMQRTMYVRFQDALGGRQERTFPRQRSMDRVRLVDGLSRCHYMLNRGQPFLPENVWGRAHRMEPTASAKEPETAEEAVEMSSVVVSRKDASEGGMALFQPRNATLRTRVGELVAYANSDTEASPETWRLATIRWVRTQPGQGLELGMEYLADSGHAAASKAISGPGPGAAYLRTLVIPRVNPLKEPATLVTPAGAYDVGSRLALNMGERVMQVTLTEMLESTRRYAHFRFDVIPGAEADEG